MINGTLSDYATFLRHTREIQSLRSSMETIGTELATGLKADLSEDGGGLVGAIFGIDRDIQRLDRVTFGLNRADTEATSAQAALGLVSDVTGSLGLNLSAAISRGDATSTLILQGEASQTLDAVFGALNTTIAGRSLFAGTGTDGPALTGANTLRTDIAAIVAAAPDAATAFADIDAYLNDPGGPFETTIYSGTTDDQIGVMLPDGTRAQVPPRADDPAFRNVLGVLAGLAAISETSFGGNTPEQRSFAAEAAGRLIEANSDVITLRAFLGQSEERIAGGLSEAEAEISVLRRARNDLAARDPYEAATEFTNLEGQLQTLYAVTARLSSLSLTNYLR